MSQIISLAIDYLIEKYHEIKFNVYRKKQHILPLVASENLFRSEIFVRNPPTGSREFNFALKFNKKFLAITNVLDFRKLMMRN